MTEILNEYGPVFGWTLLLSAIITGGVRRYALVRQMIDVPNARSSHRIPTPRGGGVAIVLCFLAAVVYLYATGRFDGGGLVAIAGAGLIVAGIGFLDDHGHIAARWRLLAHFVAAILAVSALGGAAPLVFLGTTVDLGWAGHGLAVFYVMWLLNLYNFMDGIDGIAGTEAVCVGFGAAVLAIAAGGQAPSGAPLILAAAAAGFLMWNAPPAKIFMGDAGSGFLGFVIGVMSLQAGWVDPALFWGWLILLGVFVVDATVTLLRRLARGDRVYEAHRSHAYQHAARRVGRHGPITFAAAAINAFWLLPIALFVAVGRIDGFIGLVIAYMPLMILAVALRAGEPESLQAE